MLIYQPIFSFFQTHEHKQISITFAMCSDLCTCLHSTQMCLDQLVVVFVMYQVTNRGVPSGGLTMQCNHTITCLKVLLLSLLYFLKFYSSANANTDTHSKQLILADNWPNKSIYYLLIYILSDLLLINSLDQLSHN